MQSLYYCGCFAPSAPYFLAMAILMARTSPIEIPSPFFSISLYTKKISSKVGASKFPPMVRSAATNNSNLLLSNTIFVYLYLYYSAVWVKFVVGIFSRYDRSLTTDYIEFADIHFL